MVKKVFIDPGHGGNDRSNRGPTGYVEADGTLDLALRLKQVLVARGYQVMLSRETDLTVPLEQRPAAANQWGADVLLSIHTNSNGPTAGGIETWFSRNGEWGEQFHLPAQDMARAVQQQLVLATGLRDRGAKARLVTREDSPIRGMDYYAVIRKARCPAVIVEVGFHSNPQEEALLKTKEFRQLAAAAIAQGLTAVLGEQVLPTPPAPEQQLLDVPKDHWARPAVEWVVSQGLMLGYPDGTFRGEASLNRYELAVVIHRALAKVDSSPVIK